MNREEVYAEKINATVKTKAVFSDQADQMLYQVKRFGQRWGSLQHDAGQQDFRRAGKVPDAVGIGRTDIL